jgi:uncharacterized repeat protein (TIGR03803 family)
VRKAFGNAPANPVGDLVQGRDGYFYGVTQSQQGDMGLGPSFGTVFKISPAGTLTVLKSFGHFDGAYPSGSLVQGRDGDFYGMTYMGGARGTGTVYKISPTGTFTVLYNFSYSDGGYPNGSLVQGRDGGFYGMTSSGGNGGAGTVFRITPTGAFTVLKHFDYSDGAYPYGSLVQGSDGDFYGMTSSGGNAGAGTVFKITPTGAFTVLTSFNHDDGASPFGSLVQGRDGDYYGITSSGGERGYGTVFKITPAGMLTVLKSFDYNDGAFSYSSLVQGTDGDFYGMTQQGGQYGLGTVFKITPTGTHTVLMDFDFRGGNYPQGSLVQGTDGAFYGMTYLGGSGGYSGYGTIFKISPAGTLTVLSNFDNSEGTNPYGSLVQGTDGAFYGMTRLGGSNQRGTVFKVSRTGTHTVLKSFSGPDGGNPWGSLVQGSDGNFYGMTNSGGNAGAGTVFKISPAGTFTVLKHFNGSDGANPYGSLVQGTDGDFYGMTQQGGSSGQGTVFKISPAGTHTVLKSFNHDEGTNPQGSLVQGSDGDFYGMTNIGGPYGYGTVFKMSPTGILTVLKSLNHDDGGNPWGSLVQGSDGDFYGMTSIGGIGGGGGTVFKISSTGTHTILKTFDYYEGSRPHGGLVQGSDGDFYGMTILGGGGVAGTIFKISPTGAFTVLKSLDYHDGISPFGSLVIDRAECTPPVLTAPANVTVNNVTNNLYGSCEARVAFAASATGTPAPGILYKVGDEVITSPHYFPLGTTTVTATAVNSCGRVTESFTVTVVDQKAPVPVVPALPDVTGECSVELAATPQAYDECAGTVAATTTDPLRYTTQGTYTVTWTYRDDNGNTATQAQKVVVKDRTAPVPVLATLPQATGECSVTATAPRATDDCRGSITATTTDPTTYTAQGTFVIHWRYDDGRGNVTEQPQTVLVKDVTNPSVTAPAALTLVNDPGQCGRSLSNVTLGTPVTSDNCGTVKPATHDAPAFFPAGTTTTVTWTVEDAAGNQSTATQRVTITNAEPVLGTIAAPVSPVGINTAVQASADFRDTNLADATWDWGNGTTPGTIDQVNGKITGNRTYSTPGVHTVTLTVTDACGKTAVSTFRYVVVYDPNGGFVTGGGWINSPVNAYAPDPAATGVANFGFVSRYRQGTTQPAGNTNFELKAAGLEFTSTAYEWLVVSGPQAQFKGAGTLNGQPGYKFILTATDGQVNGGADRFRIKIWQDGETVPVYDNQRGAADDASATTAIGGGSIMVQDGRNKARESTEVRSQTSAAAATLSGFPNPFTGKTSIEFTFHREEEYALEVYDLNGRLVAALGAGKAEAGKTNWVVWEAKTAPGGVYFARLTTRSGVQHVKLVLR